MTTAMMKAETTTLSTDQIELVKRTIAKDATNDELALFLAQCARTGLDPLSRQIYFIKRGGKGSVQVSIDGFRVVAERTGELNGQDLHWCGDDGVWLDVWVKKEKPAAARVIVYRKGCDHGFPGVARWSEYQAGGPMWDKMPATMLAKCAEALALRKAFPHQLSGLYTSDEMDQSAPPHVEHAAAIMAPVHEATQVDPPSGALWITRTEPKSGKKAGEVAFSDGTVATVWMSDARLFELAEQCCQNGEAVVPEFRPGSGNYGPTLKNLRRYDTPPVAPAPPPAIDASDIPF